MDKLKYIKLENDDGSYSDAIPLAVDSDYVNVDGDTLTNELNKKANATAVSNSINELSTKVNSLSNGSPAGVYATVAALTTADPDHNKIYVVSADGHWYYYSNGNWADGGIYQGVLDDRLDSAYNTIDYYANTKIDEFALQYGYVKNLNNPAIWEAGHIKSTDGTNGLPGVEAYSHNIRTKTYLNKSISRLQIVQDELGHYNSYDFYIYIYQNDTYINRLGPVQVFTDFNENYDYRIGLHCNNTINLLDYSNILLLADTNVDDVLYNGKNISNKIDYDALTYNYMVNLNNFNLWEWGTFNTTDWTLNASTKMLVTPNYLDSKIVYAKIPSDDFRMLLFIFDKNGTYIRTTSAVKEYSEFNHDLYNYKMAFRRKLVNNEVVALGPKNLVSNLLLLGYPSFLTTKNEIDTLLSRRDSAMMNGYLADLNINESDWEQGHIKSADGTNGASSAEDYSRSIRYKGFVSNDIVTAYSLNSAYKINVYTYLKSDESYVERVANKVQTFSDFDHETYYYRLTLYNSNTTTPAEGWNQVAFYTEALPFENKKNPSVFYKKDTLINNVPRGFYYSGLGTDYSLFNRNTLYDFYIDKLDTLVADYSDYITVTELGTDSADYPIKMYDFMPTQFELANKTKDIPKILFIAGQQGVEKCNCFGLYYFLQDLLTKWDENPILDYIRHHVRLMIIPVVSPWGFDNLSYINANGISLNRNYDQNFIVYTGDDPNQYGGTEPFSEPETQIVRDFVLANLDAIYFADCHTCGNASTSAYKDINWHAFSSITDTMYNKILNAAQYHIKNITAHFKKDYNLDIPETTLCGRITAQNSGHGICKNWVTNQGVIGSTFECTVGFPSRPGLSAEAQKANSELIGNWFITILSTLEKNYSDINDN